MADDKISKPIPCKQCRKPFVRTHGRQRICPDCKRAVKTGKGVESPAQAKKWAERVTSTKKPTGGGTRRSGQGPAARSAAPLVAKFAFPGLVAHLDTEILSTQARLDKLKELRQSAVELGA